MVIEVELRSFISKRKYYELIHYFNKHAILESFDEQTTNYISDQIDLRIQKNNFFAKVWMKKGNMHDEHREEIEVHFNRNDFSRLSKLFSELGFETKIKWRRKRHTFLWEKINVMIDYTYGYGYIIELEVMTNSKNKEVSLNMLHTRFKELRIDITPRKEFEKKYLYYKKNWRRLIKDK